MVNLIMKRQSIIDNNENRLKKVEDRIAEINNNITSFQKKNGSEFVKAINIILKKTDIDLLNQKQQNLYVKL